MSETPPVFVQNPTWPGEGTSRVPFWAYTRDDLYQRELERFF
jgi:salicylate 5-hydroxylase large subunit